MSVLRGLLPRTLVLVVVSPSLCRGCGGVGVEKGTVEPVSDAGWWQGRAACSSSSALQAAVSLSGDGHGPRGWWSNTRAQRLESPALIAVVVMRRGRMSSRCWAEGIRRFVAKGSGCASKEGLVVGGEGVAGTGESVCCFSVDAMRDGCPGSRLGNGGHGRKRLEMDAMFFFPLRRVERTVFQSETCGWPTKQLKTGGRERWKWMLPVWPFFSLSPNRPPVPRISLEGRQGGEPASTQVVEKGSSPGQASRFPHSPPQRSHSASPSSPSRAVLSVPNTEFSVKIPPRTSIPQKPLFLYRRVR